MGRGNGLLGNLNVKMNANSASQKGQLHKVVFDV